MPNSRQRISIHNLKAGMVLADDAVTPNGQLLIPSGTRLTENHLFRMNLYQILSAAIQITDGKNPVDPLLETMADEVFLPGDMHTNEIRLRKTEGFLRFNKVYMKVDTIIRELFDDLLLGHPIDEKKLLATTDTLISSARLKSDLFTYMHQIRSENYHTYVHSINVSILCNMFGHWLKLPKEDLDELTLAALIHDIGKTKISLDLLNKSEKLTEEEFNQVREHAQIGYEIIKESNFSQTVKDAVLLHHERNDGSGYPFGFTREEIPDFAKIIAITDVYDAMTTNRTYHKKFSPFNVIQIFEQEPYGNLDAKFLFTFLENIAHHYLGEEVRLSDGTIGKIVFIHNQSPSRPIIQAGDLMIDLLATETLTIDEIL